MVRSTEDDRRELIRELIDEFEENGNKKTAEIVQRIITHPKTYDGVAREMVDKESTEEALLKTRTMLRAYWQRFSIFCKTKSLELPILAGGTDEALGYQAARAKSREILVPKFIVDAVLWQEAMSIVQDRNEKCRKVRGRLRFTGKRIFVASVRAYCRILGGTIDWDSAN